MITYTLAGGCFWCLDAVYRRVQGVKEVQSGYSGGSQADAQYLHVATGATGHAEAVQVTFDEAIIPKEAILDLFFLIHNPTTLNRQGADIGPQYRSAMFYVNEGQRQDFSAAIQRAARHWSDPIVTQLTPLEAFYPAENEHQDYFNKNPGNGYCSAVIYPKITKARTALSQWFE